MDEEKLADYDILRWRTIEDGQRIGIGLNRPSGYLKFINIDIALFGKLPNRFQRYMLKKVFAIEIVEVKKDA